MGQALPARTRRNRIAARQGLPDALLVARMENRTGPLIFYVRADFLMRMLLLLILMAIPTVHAAEPLSAMTFNLRGDFDEGVPTDKPTAWLSTTGTNRRDISLELIREADPDLLGVQEAYQNQVAEIDAALASHDVYTVGRDDGREAGEHCAIYYRRERFEPVDEGTFWLSNDPEKPSTYPGAACPRIASWVVLRDRQNDRELLVLNTHWDHVSSEARRHSAEMIRERLAELRGKRPAIVMGDLNVGEEQPPIQKLLGSDEDRLVDSYRTIYPEQAPNERSFHGFRGGEQGHRIDYLLTTTGFRATDAAIVRTDFNGVYPSDHYPVTAVLEWAE